MTAHRMVAVRNSVPRIAASRVVTPLWRPARFASWGPVADEIREIGSLPGANWVRLRNVQCGICATDVAFLNARVDPSISVAALPGREEIFLGHELVAVVEEVGAGVSRVEPGDRVILDTRFQGATCATAEADPWCARCADGDFMLCENPDRLDAAPLVGGGWGTGLACHEFEIYPCPPGLSDDRAMLVEPLSLGVRAVGKSGSPQLSNALVIGSGMAGMAIVCALRSLHPECAITVVARHERQAALASEFGAAHIARAMDPEELASQAGARLYKRPFGAWFAMGGFDCVFDTVGSKKTIDTALRLSRAGGRAVLVGISLERTNVDLSPLWHQEVSVAGVLAHGCEHGGSQPMHTYDMVIDRVFDSGCAVEKLITDRFAFDDWKSAVGRSEQRADGVVRVGLDIEARSGPRSPSNAPN